MRFEPTIEAAQTAHDNGYMREWLTAYLNSDGGDAKLLKVIDLYDHVYLGPIDYPLMNLVSILGPAQHYKYPVQPELWDQQMTGLTENIKAGWTPPPLIVTDYWTPNFEINHGSHHKEALLRAGITTHPVIFYFRDEPSRERLRSYVDSLSAPA